MSTEAPKVEEVVAAPTPAIVEPTAEATPAVEAATDAAPVTEAPAAEEVAEPVVDAAPEEVKPVEEGTLGYKGPGLLKGLIFQKKFFWFGTEPVESKALSSYLRGEKVQDAANKNVAWAAHTGKGLLFFSKKPTEKATPHGVFNLSEISDVAEEGTVAFFFSSGGHKHTFETSTSAERDNWVAVLKAKTAEAKELATTVVETEEYKKALNDLSPVAAAATPKKSVEKETKEEKKEDKTEEKKARKSRSVSRNAKRNSIFGGFGLGKKEEKVETPVVAAEEPAATEPAAETTPAVVEPAVEPAAAPETTEEVAPVEPVTPVAEKPAHVKRGSIFGTLKSKYSSKTEKKTEEVPVKEAEPVSETAPVLPETAATEPIEALETPAAPAEVVETPAAEKVETPVVKSDKRKSSIPFFTKKEKVEKPTSEDEAIKEEKPFFAKLRATVKGKKADKPAEKPVEEPIVDKEEETPAPAEPAVVSEPVPVIPASTPVVAASA